MYQVHAGANPVDLVQVSNQLNVLRVSVHSPTLKILSNCLANFLRSKNDLRAVGVHLRHDLSLLIIPNPDEDRIPNLGDHFLVVLNLDFDGLPNEDFTVLPHGRALVVGEP